jgi:hypothetical protein
MLVLSALIVPCGLLVLMMAMQQVQERLLPPGGPVLAADLVDNSASAATPLRATPVAVVVIPAQATSPESYESSDSVVGSASLTSASPSR